MTSAGPVTKTTSSATLSAANAVCRSLATGEQVGPAGAHHGADLRDRGTRERGPDVRPRQRPVLDDRDDHQRRGQREGDRVDVQHRPWPNRSASRPWGIAKAALPTMYAAETWPARRVGPAQRAHQQHDAQRHHRDRQPGDEAGGREGEGAGVGEHPAVGGEHRRASLGWPMRSSGRRRPPQEPPDLQPYDALLLVSFGGPEKPDDVVPFLRNVTAGQGHPGRRGSRRSASTTSSSAAAARSTTRTAP